MASQKETIVRIENEQGKRYAVSEHTYKNTKIEALDDKTYEDAGYKIVSYEDGTPYGTDAQPTAYAIDKTASTQGIGEGGTNPTNVDGGKVTPEYAAATGVTVSEAPKSKSSTRSEPAPAPAPAQSR